VFKRLSDLLVIAIRGLALGLGQSPRGTQLSKTCQVGSVVCAVDRGSEVSFSTARSSECFSKFQKSPSLEELSVTRS